MAPPVTNDRVAGCGTVDASLVFTMPNADVGGRGLFDLVQEFVRQLTARLSTYLSGQTLYLSVLALSAGVAGNSS